MQSRWCIAEKLKLFKRNSEGKIVPCLPMVFRDGDFVEVTAHVDIVSRGKGSRGQHDVHFVLEHLIQIKSKKDLAVRDNS